MTAVVGVLCSDGIVVGTDSSTTFGSSSFRTIEQPSEKLFVVAEKIVVAGTGFVGHGQRFQELVQLALVQNVFTRSKIEIGKCLSASMIQDFSVTQAPRGQYGALVAFPANDEFHLCEFDGESFQPEFKTDRLWYCSMGSAQPITDPFLGFMRDVFWSDGMPSVRDAVFAATWTLDHAIAVNPGGVNGPARIAVLQKDGGGNPGARLLTDAELQEHREYIRATKVGMREFRRGDLDADSPELPSP